MKKVTVFLLLSVSFVVFISFNREYEPANEVPYPEGYRKWRHIKTGILRSASPDFQSNTGFHHIYANDKAMKGYTSGKFPEGTILVFDVLEAVEKGGNTDEGERKVIDVMIKDSTKFLSTGGWGYEEFKGNSRTERVLTEAVRMKCISCHARQKDNVFSDLRE